MESISVKLPADVLEANRRHARAERMARVSRKVRKENMRVNAEFAAIERDPVA
jgi:hypothetical protein